jgi:hypothetical protein
MQTRNGIKVTKLQKLGDSYVGLVNGKLLTWDKEGRRSSKNRSKLDLSIETEKTKVFYVNVVDYNGTIRISREQFKTYDEAVSKSNANRVKTDKIDLA